MIFSGIEEGVLNFGRRSYKIHLGKAKISKATLEDGIYEISIVKDNMKIYASPIKKSGSYLTDSFPDVEKFKRLETAVVNIEKRLFKAEEAIENLNSQFLGKQLFSSIFTDEQII